MGMFDLGLKDAITPVTDVVKDLIQLFPNAEQRAAAATKLQDAELAIAQGQLAVNAEEAKNPSIFVSGWRPAIGWVCVAGFTYNLAAAPIGLPHADSEAMQTMLFGMLGLGTMRTVEKVQGVVKGRK